jgi:hypothetical protein
MRFMALGHSLREAECLAAAIVIDCLMISTIMGYRFSDAERERLPASGFAPEIRSMTAAGHCGTVPACVGRDGILLHCQLNPARPSSCGEYGGPAGQRGTFSAACGAAGTVCW